MSRLIVVWRSGGRVRAGRQRGRKLSPSDEDDCDGEEQAARQKFMLKNCAVRLHCQVKLWAKWHLPCIWHFVSITALPPSSHWKNAMTNMEGINHYGQEWKTMVVTDLHAYMGLLIKAGVYRWGEAGSSLWNDESGRPIFRAIVSLEMFCNIATVLR